MINGLKPYPELKDSGVEWLGEVPAHWQVVMVKQNYTIQLGKMLQPRPNTLQDVEIPYLKAQHVQWFHVRTTDVPKMWAGQKDIAQFGVASGDLLVCEGGEGGRCGILRQDVEGYIIQNALHRVRSRKQSRNDYLQYVMSSVAATGWFDALNNKATIAHFTKEKFGALRVPVPPPPEQTAIVRFLDYADRRIRLYIRSKQKLIALLEEQKQAIIHQAVTGQVDVRTGQPYTAYKPSGVEWLGDVPTHWETPRIKQCARTISKGTTPSTEGRETSEYGQVRFLKAENITSGEISDKPLLYIDEDTNNLLRRSQLQEGDVLFVIAGATLGKTALVREELLPANTNQAVAFIRPHKRLDSIYLAYWLQSPRVKELTWLNAVQSAQPNLSMTNLGNFFIPFSPFPEQAVIVSYLDRATAAVDIVIRHTRYQIDHLSEYRTRLIADVVTGKFDVREAAAALPEVDPLAAENDLNDTFDTDAGSALDELDADLEEAEA